MNENENTTTQNLWDSVKAVLRGKFIAIQGYLNKQEKNQINFTPKETRNRRNENMTTQNLCDAAKAVPRGKFIAIQSFLKKQEKHQIDNLTLHLKQLGKKQQQKKISRRKEIIQI